MKKDYYQYFDIFKIFVALFIITQIINIIYYYSCCTDNTPNKTCIRSTKEIK